MFENSLLIGRMFRYLGSKFFKNRLLGGFLETNGVFRQFATNFFRPQLVVVKYNLQLAYLEFIFPNKSARVNISNGFLENFPILVDF